MNADNRRIDFREPLHTTGEDVPIPPYPITQALAWWVAAEMARRHPNEIRLVLNNVHAYGAAVTLLARSHEDPPWRLVAWLNPGELCHITPASWFGPSDSGRFNWLEVLLAPDRRDYVIRQLERVEGLTSPKASPPTTQASIGPRLIEAFLRKTVLGPDRWVVINGYETDDDDEWINRELFAPFPELVGAPGVPDPSRTPGGTAAHYWFICRRSASDPPAPVMAINLVTGVAWSKTESVDLLVKYRQLNRSLDALVSAILPPTDSGVSPM